MERSERVAQPPALTLPAAFHRLDAKANALQTRSRSLLLASLVATVAASACGLLTLDDGAYDEGGLLMAAAFTLGILLAEFSQRARTSWHSGRALAEEVRAHSWAYVMRAGRYGGDHDAAAKLLRRRLAEAQQNPQLLAPMRADGERQWPAGLEALRRAALGERRTAYQVGRVDEQRLPFAASSGAPGDGASTVRRHPDAAGRRGRLRAGSGAGLGRRPVARGHRSDHRVRRHLAASG